jgi:hypothetical protein
VKRDGKSLLEWIRIHSLRGLPGLAGPELGFLRTPTASVLRNDACLRLPARNIFGIEDEDTGAIDVVAEDLFRGLGLCSEV